MSIRSSRTSSFSGFAFLGLAIVHLDSPASGLPAIGPGIIGSPKDDRQGRGAVRVHAALSRVTDRVERSRLADPGPDQAVFISTGGEPAGSAHQGEGRIPRSVEPPLVPPQQILQEISLVVLAQEEGGPDRLVPAFS